MTPEEEEREELSRLCLPIQNEKDHQRFTELLRELNQLLEKKECRFRDEQNADPLLR